MQCSAVGRRSPEAGLGILRASTSAVVDAVAVDRACGEGRPSLRVRRHRRRHRRSDTARYGEAARRFFHDRLPLSTGADRARPYEAIEAFRKSMDGSGVARAADGQRGDRSSSRWRGAEQLRLSGRRAASRRSEPVRWVLAGRTFFRCRVSFEVPNLSGCGRRTSSISTRACARATASSRQGHRWAARGP